MKQTKNKTNESKVEERRSRTKSEKPKASIVGTMKLDINTLKSKDDLVQQMGMLYKELPKNVLEEMASTIWKDIERKKSEKLDKEVMNKDSIKYDPSLDDYERFNQMGGIIEPIVAHVIKCTFSSCIESFYKDKDSTNHIGFFAAVKFNDLIFIGSSFCMPCDHGFFNPSRGRRQAAVRAMKELKSYFNNDMVYVPNAPYHTKLKDVNENRRLLFSLARRGSHAFYSMRGQEHLVAGLKVPTMYVLDYPLNQQLHYFIGRCDRYFYKGVADICNFADQILMSKVTGD